MLREIHIGSFSKAVANYRPELFSALTVLEHRPYNPQVECYQVADHHQDIYQLYLTEKELEPVLQEIEFIEKSPKILLLEGERDHIILEERVEETLYDRLLALENTPAPAPFLDEPAARQLLLALREGVENYRAHGVEYNAISPRNIVRRGADWQLSLAGLLLRNEKESADYYKGVKREYAQAYAMGTLLFKLLFGFVPFEKRRERSSFSFKDYLRHLDKEENKKALKIYYFADRLLEVSEKGKQLIELALRGDATLDEFYSHEYFSKDTLLGRREGERSVANREVRMLALFQTGQQSLVMAAIEHHRKYPQERINSKLLYAHELAKEEVVAHLRKHPVLSEMDFHPSFAESKLKASLPAPRHAPLPALPYFYREEQFDPELDYPCRELIKLVQHYQEELRPDRPEQLEAAIKLYAYPYAMVFELHKAGAEQPEEVVGRIGRVSEDLLQISQLHWLKGVRPLHQTELLVRSFEEIKLRFREGVNQLYRHFLGEAIRKYNVRKEVGQYAERSRQKQQGLECYRLCLKLMECSLLVRKEGRELDLVRIETSARKELESDLNQLLRQYFPNKIELT